MENKEQTKDEILHSHPIVSNNKGSNLYVTLEAARKSMDKYADQWKVKHDELHSELHETKQQADNLRIAYDELGRKAQHMADALESIANAPVPANDREMLSWFVTAKNIAQGALSELEADKYVQQFKDGEKEVDNE